MSFFDKHWREYRAKVAFHKMRGDVVITRKGRKLHVICPDSEDFCNVARVMLGVYKVDSRIWSFHIVQEEQVKALCERLWPGKVVIE